MIDVEVNHFSAGYRGGLLLYAEGSLRSVPSSVALVNILPPCSWTRTRTRTRVSTLLLCGAGGHESCLPVQWSSWEVWGGTGALVSGIMWINSSRCGIR